MEKEKYVLEERKNRVRKGKQYVEKEDPLLGEEEGGKCQGLIGAR